MPTWRGWALIFLVALAVVIPGVRGAHGFLTPTDRQPGGALVIEGWSQDYALKAAIEEFRAGGYTKLYVVGGPLEHGSVLVDYRNFADLGAASLLKMGLSTNEVQSVPAPLVAQDRTYTAAKSLAAWFREHGERPARLQLISVGPHARRSRLLFQKAFGKAVRVGIITIAPWDYDPQHWWRTSAGVRAVMDETVAYLYARLLFRPQNQSQ